MEERIRKIYEADPSGKLLGTSLEAYMLMLIRTYDAEQDIYNSFDEMIERYEIELETE